MPRLPDPVVVALAAAWLLSLAATLARVAGIW